MPSNIKAAPLVAALAGGILLWSGVKGRSISQSLRSVLAGQNPENATQVTAIVGSDTGPASPADPISTGNSTYNEQVPNTTNIGGGAAQNQAIGRLLAAPYGWSAGENWTDLLALWTRESGWSNVAKNPSSGAYGIAQALPESKYPPAGQESGGSSASAQIQWGLQYINSRYGSPSAAWAHETSMGWY